MGVLSLKQIRHGGLFVDGHTEYLCHRLLAWKPLVFIIQTQLGSQQLNGVFAIRSVHDRKGRRETAATTELAQHQVGERMKGSSRNLAAAVIDQQASAPQH